MRYSRQRAAILDLLRSTTTHPDAESIYVQLRQTIPAISLGTVYRNLRQMASLGDVKEILCGSSVHYDGNIGNHYHLLCEKCGALQDIPESMVSVSVSENNDFTVSGINLIFYGICQNCKKNL